MYYFINYYSTISFSIPVTFQKDLSYFDNLFLFTTQKTLYKAIYTNYL
ncbi:hypothetical protein UC317_0552 [Lactococcus lactis subsp. lactis]|uniref:Uncharacterized protein n=1 Tax=Lactococcus lactis subsp. lactis TaxID=1360 RepID=A0A0V8C2X1_LACLL|nr:hypothetical protein Llab_0532 [Lactococcus lactis]KST79656.1 hypothetical protein LK231_0943 [Lactococcus lactis subsp. lactis]CDI47381.1 hypothetical protein BN927_02449 [Lactococcus lactis subsp. lactis Dephy 1]KST92284.1 hypothetical protein KF134_0456 [Lactococcus lactis subsp. lactis]KST95610.1 hypothetical protein KF146_1642 [Lactococcus lactis subsp. lactis]